MQRVALVLGFASLLFCNKVAAQNIVVGNPTLAVKYVGRAIDANIDVGGIEFIGGVLISLDPRPQNFFVGLPPLLANSVVLGVGTSVQGILHLRVAHDPLPPDGVVYFCEAVTLSLAGIQASDVVKLATR